MQIKSLHIYGFGKFIDFRIEDMVSLQVLYGENEAGKSTIMAFIHCILFGFPSRQQAILRYEPKAHSAYGGKIIFETKNDGKMTIERVKGKSAGEVFVMFEDGRSGDESLLSEIIQGVDRTIYENIFSFNLHGLQEVHRLKDEDITRYLIAIGTLGTDKLFHTEQALQKELDRLFKPSGRKPQLNEQLNLLREADKELKIAKQQNAEYESILMKKNQILNNINDLDDQSTKNQQELQHINELVNNWPLIQEKSQIEQELESLGTIRFPTEGLVRFENYSEKVISLTSRFQAIQNKIKETKELVKENEPHSSFDLVEAEKVIDAWPAFKHLKEKIRSIEIEITEYHDQAEEISRELYFPINKWDKLPELNLGIDVKGQIKDALQHDVRLTTNLDEIDARIKELEKEVDRTETICSHIEKQLVSESEFKALQKELKQHIEAEDLMREKAELEEKLQHLSNQENRHSQTEKKEKKIAYIKNGAFLFVSLALMIWTLVTTQWVISIFAILAIIYSLSSLYSLKNKTELSAGSFEIDRIKKRINEIKENLKGYSGGPHQVEFYNQQLQLRDEWKTAYTQIDQHQQRLEILNEQKSEYQQFYQDLQDKLHDLRSNLGLTSQFTLSRLDDAYDLLIELLKVIKLKDRKKTELQQHLHHEEQWINQLREISLSTDFNKNEVDEYFYKVRDLVRIEKEKEATTKELLSKLSEIQPEAASLKIEIEQYNQSIDELLQLADVDNEEEFRVKADKYDKITKLSTRISMIEALIKHIHIPEECKSKTEASLKEKQKILRKRTEEIQAELNKLRHELAALQHHQQVLEEGGTYTEKLHQFYHLQSIFNDDARNWAKIALAKALLNRTMHAYKQDRFPKVIEKAEEYFAFLTVDEYRKILFEKEGNLLIERNDGMTFNPAELSRGTGEQLYTAIRFALVHVLSKDHPFPIIIDDGFVNFDKRRTSRVIQLIEKISQSSQVLLFTCHEHIREQFSDSDVLSLTENRNLKFSKSG